MSDTKNNMSTNDMNSTIDKVLKYMNNIKLASEIASQIISDENINDVRAAINSLSSISLEGNLQNKEYVNGVVEKAKTSIENINDLISAISTSYDGDPVKTLDSLMQLKRDMDKAAYDEYWNQETPYKGFTRLIARNRMNKKASELGFTIYAPNGMVIDWGTTQPVMYIFGERGLMVSFDYVKEKFNFIDDEFKKQI